MAEKKELIELRFRIFDGTDIGHATYAPSTTVASLKQKLVAEWPQGKTIVPKSVNDVKVIHAGRVLENRRTLADSKITFGNPPGEVITMHVVIQPTITKKRTGLSKLLCFFFFLPTMGLESGNSQKKTQNAQDFWKLQHGCEHYKRRCKIRAPCCDQIFSCRHCHNEATSSLSNPKERHEIVRHDIKQVICSICNTEQQVAQVCSNCGVKMGEYFCDICKFYDDETEKKQFHCDECGICRVGGHENFFHCQKCGSCYPVGIRDKHICVENSMKCSCPVCYEYLFDSVKGASIMKCGHAMHTECYSEMANQHQYRCPICFKTVFDVSNEWKLLDEEIKAMPMPEAYKYEVQILCNDCNKKSEAPFHILGHKCRECDSYNTRRISTPNLD